MKGGIPDVFKGEEPLFFPLVFTVHALNTWGRSLLPRINTPVAIVHLP